MLKLFFLLISVLYYISGLSQENIVLTYTGNMGVFISNGQSSVLIDGLHTKYKDDYLFPTKTLINKINTTLKPNVLLFTHYHNDHFSTQLSEAYLKLHKKSILLGPGQITKHFSEYKDQIITISTKDHEKQSIGIGEIMIMGFKINHAGKKHVSVENIGYIVQLNDKKIMHVGDTNWFEKIDLFAQLQLIDESIDIAILPYWMLLQDNASTVIKKYIDPKQLIATHISPRIKEGELLALKKRYPNIHFFTTLEQQIHL